MQAGCRPVGAAAAVPLPAIRKGLEVGALIVHREKAQAVRGLLHELSWLKKGCNVSFPSREQLCLCNCPSSNTDGSEEATHQDQLLALHLNHEGASLVQCLEALQGNQARQLMDLVRSGGLCFVPGLRLGAKFNPNLRPLSGQGAACAF